MRIRRQTFGRTLTPVLVLAALFLFANWSNPASETAAPSQPTPIPDAMATPVPPAATAIVPVAEGAVQIDWLGGFTGDAWNYTECSRSSEIIVWLVVDTG